jgi:hypothetical protein
MQSLHPSTLIPQPSFVISRSRCPDPHTPLTQGYSDGVGCWGTYQSGRDSAGGMARSGTRAPRVFRMWRAGEDEFNLPQPLARCVTEFSLRTVLCKINSSKEEGVHVISRRWGRLTDIPACYHYAAFPSCAGRSSMGHHVRRCVC